MLKLPFYNRKNYTLMKFYSASKYANDLAPPTLTAQAKHCTFGKEDNRHPAARAGSNSFRTCYGMTSSLRKSITIPSWCDWSVTVYDGKLDIASSVNPDYFPTQNHSDDPDYNMRDGMMMIKIVNTWRVEMESSDVNPEFVCASHILNTTPMMIPTGILTFRNQYDVNIFNKIDCTYDHWYKVPFQHPLLQLFPLSTTKLYVEHEYNMEKWQQLGMVNGQLPYFRGTHLKLLKPNKKT